jgi:PPOX class probable F420-dependent enzyme
MAKLNAAARQLITSGALAHLVTLNEDGSPQVAVVWVDVDGDDLICAHLDPRQRKLANLRRDPRVAVSFEGTESNPVGMREHLVVRGTASVTEGGAPQLLAKLAKVYIGPDAVFPPMDNPPPGFITRISINRVTGIGDWSAN